MNRHPTHTTPHGNPPQDAPRAAAGPAPVVAGAGPSGLGAALELAEAGKRPVVYETLGIPGGIARTLTHNGYHFDIGGHRFFSDQPSIRRLWRRMMGPDLLEVDRTSRIYYNGRFIDYPLKAFETLKALGPVESARIVASWLRAQAFPCGEERTFDQWMINRFGRRLYETFFKTYTEKVWGIPCTRIGADWAAQRIRGLSLVSALGNALLGTRNARTLADRFYYPVRGPGMMWDRFAEAIRKAGGEIHLGTEVTGVEHAGGRVTAVTVRGPGGTETVPVSHLVSSMPLPGLVALLRPAAPETVAAAAGALAYRAFVLAGLVVRRRDIFRDQWIYIHSPEVRVGRVQNFVNWSPAMSPDPETTHVGMEYFCDAGDDLWTLSDAGILDLASSELERLGLARRRDVVDGMVCRQPHAYPVYDPDYSGHLKAIRRYLEGFDNLQTIGRNGMHRYNNMDQAMQTGILAARNVMGATNDLWALNQKAEYLEAGRLDADSLPGTPPPARAVFEKMDKVAFGTALGSVGGTLLFLATLWLVLKGGAVVGPTLGLLGNYFFGYTVTVGGAFAGLAYGFVSGYVFGWTLAWLRNLLFAVFWYRVRKSSELKTLKEFFDHL